MRLSLLSIGLLATERRNADEQAAEAHDD